ncbi:phosphotransferase family protein [Kribbella sp. CA-253562]|uniref:phosphotransferase family protein n=1 Tax=Kribbella sp. CA-253562 TaxID=3239942 RepID=UPI003D8C23B1
MGDQVLEQAAALAALQAITPGFGLDSSAAELMGPVADNAVFRLPGQIVARVTASADADRARREVAAGRWLAAQGLPAVRPVESIEQPVIAAAYVVTFWHEVPEAVMASTAELGALLRQLHDLPLPNDFEIPPLDPFVRLDEHLTAAGTELTQEDRTFLAHRLLRLRDDYTKVTIDSVSRVIHGDANRKNAIRGADGVAVLLDLERFSVGPPEWDLVVPAVYQRLGWYSDAEYDAFVEAYGRDVRHWTGFGVFAALREFRMTVWLLSRLAREPRLRAEAERRIHSLRHPATSRSWTPGA